MRDPHTSCESSRTNTPGNEAGYSNPGGSGREAEQPTGLDFSGGPVPLLAGEALLVHVVAELVQLRRLDAVGVLGARELTSANLGGERADPGDHLAVDVAVALDEARHVALVDPE